MNIRTWQRKLMKWNVYKSLRRIEKYTRLIKKVDNLRIEAQYDLMYWQKKLHEVENNGRKYAKRINR